MEGAGVIYRSLRSDSVFVSLETGELRLAHSSHTTVTGRSGERVSDALDGSVYYLSPEAVRSYSTCTSTMTVWALGCLLRQLLTNDAGYMDFPPLRALFMTLTKGAAPLKQPLAADYDAAVAFHVALPQQ